MSEPQEDGLIAALDAVGDESSFARFVALLVDDRRAADSLPLTIDGFHGEWANQSIASFLEAARSWALDSNFGERPTHKQAIRGAFLLRFSGPAAVTSSHQKATRFYVRFWPIADMLPANTD